MLSTAFLPNGPASPQFGTPKRCSPSRKRTSPTGTKSVPKQLPIYLIDIPANDELIDARQFCLHMLTSLINRLINENEQSSDFYLAHFVPSFLNWKITGEKYSTMARRNLLKNMRHSLVRLRDRVRVEVVDTAGDQTFAKYIPEGEPDWVTIVPDGEWDHIEEPCIFVSRQILGCLGNATTEADVQHVLLRVCVSFAKDLSWLWACSRFHPEDTDRAMAVKDGVVVQEMLCGGTIWLSSIMLDDVSTIRCHALLKDSNVFRAGVVSDQWARALFHALCGTNPDWLPLPWFQPDHCCAATVPFDGDMRDAEVNYEP